MRIDTLWGRRALLAAGAIALLCVPLLHLSDYTMRIATMTCVYVVAAAGWTLIGGYANQITLGQATMFGIGAYVSTMLFVHFHLSPWIGGPLGAIAAALAAAAIGFLVFRLWGAYFALVTLALAEMVRILVEYAQPITGGPQGISVPFVRNSVWLLQFPEAKDYYEIAALLVILALALARGVQFSPLGYRLRAIRDDEVAAKLAGIDVFRTKMIAFMLGAVLSALAGTLYAQITGFVDPDSVLSITLSVQLALYAIIGGAQVWWGPLAGAALLVPLGQAMTGSGSAAGAGLAKIVYGLLLVAIVVIQPLGIAGFVKDIRFRRRKPAAPSQAVTP
ncbi:branched-chain amino acid ABC transporter permease [bacterium]|nr:MAG: branched-chain amino acid ABC transporter permease [bacterium]